MPAAEYGSLPFSEQIEFFRQKVSLPTASWTDIWEGSHARAFVIAGAMKEDLLTDFRTAVDKVIADGVTLEQFRKDFDQIVASHGWSYNGGRGWRSRVIYDTNLRTSYQAGRYQQLKEVAELRPYWRYVHSDAVEKPRPEHLAWDGLVLLHDDPWWKTHYPPNGWGCQCTVESLDDVALQRLGKSGPDRAPAIEYETKTVGVRGPSPRTVEVPKGIDPGFGYNVGEAAYGNGLAADALESSVGSGDWLSLTPTGWSDFGRPREIPLDQTLAQSAVPLKSASATTAALARLIGGESSVFDVKGLPVNIDAKELGTYLAKDLGRTAFLPMLKEVLDDPYEVWLAFEKHPRTGYVRLRTRVIKGVEIGGRQLLFVADGAKGQLQGWNFFPLDRPSYLQKQRQGMLWWGRE